MGECGTVALTGRVIATCSSDHFRSHALSSDSAENALGESILCWLDIVHGDIDLSANQTLPQKFTSLKQVRYLIKGA